MGYTHHRTCSYTKVQKPFIRIQIALSSYCPMWDSSAPCNKKGFRLNSRRRFSVRRLRAKFFHLFRLLSRLKSLYVRAIRALMMTTKRSTTVSGGDKVVGRRRNEVVIAREINYYAMYGSNKFNGYRTELRSDSFYAEAIADCLDFIHRNSLSMEEKPVLITNHD